MRVPLSAACAAALLGCSSSPSPDEPATGVDVGASRSTVAPSTAAAPRTDDPRRPVSARPRLPLADADAYRAWLERGLKATDMIAKSAAEAFAREPVSIALPSSAPIGGVMCPTATLVPKAIPAGWVAASDRSGFDDASWRCLRFSEPAPIGAQYSYIVGSGFKSPSRGGAELGASAFEACVEADLVRGGETTLLCRTGVVDAERAMLKTTTEPFLAEEFAPDPTRILPTTSRPGRSGADLGDGGCIPVMALTMCRTMSNEACTEELAAVAQLDPSAPPCVARCARKDGACVAKCVPGCG